MRNYLDFLRSTLSPEEISRLRDINDIEDYDMRLLKTRGFFHEKEIFDKIKLYFDPSWIAHTIFIKKIDI